MLIYIFPGFNFVEYEYIYILLIFNCLVIKRIKENHWIANNYTRGGWWKLQTNTLAVVVFPLQQQ